MRLVHKICTTATVMLLFGATQVMAADMSAKAVMTKVYNYLGSLDKYAFDAVITDEYVGNGEKETLRHNVSVKLQRPDKLRIDVKGDTRDRSYYINDGQFTMIDHSFGYYGQLKVPKTIDGTLDFIVEKYGIHTPLTSLLYSNMKHRTKKFSKSKNFGVMDVAGVPCDYVAFRTKGFDVHVWVATGDKPLVKAYSIIETAGDKSTRINTSIVWKDASSIKASDFVFSAPKGVTKISIEPAN